MSFNVASEHALIFSVSNCLCRVKRISVFGVTTNFSWYRTDRTILVTCTYDGVCDIGMPKLMNCSKCLSWITLRLQHHYISAVCRLLNNWHMLLPRDSIYFLNWYVISKLKKYHDDNLPVILWLHSTLQGFAMKIVFQFALKAFCLNKGKGQIILFPQPETVCKALRCSRAANNQ